MPLTTGALQLLSIATGISPPDSHGHDEVFHLLFDNLDMDVDLNERPRSLEQIPTWWFACPDMSTLGRIQRGQSYLNEQEPLADYKLLYQAVQDDVEPWSWLYPDVALGIFGIDRRRDHLLALPDDAKDTILHLTALVLTPHDPLTHLVAKWWDLMRDIVECGARVQSTIAGRTIIAKLLDLGSLTSFDEVNGCYRSLKRWICILADAGIDSLAYGEFEILALAGAHAEEIRHRSDQSERTHGDLWSVERFIIGADAEDWSIILRTERSLAIFKTVALPGSWPRDFYSPLSIARNSWDDVEEGWTVQDIKTYTSKPFDVRECLVNYNHDPALDLINAAQDDSGPVALIMLWSRKATIARKRRSSDTPPPSQRSTVVDVRSSSSHGWLPKFHRGSFTLLGNEKDCECANNWKPDGYQHKPRWFRFFCFDHPWRRPQCPWEDVQEGWPWKDWSFVFSHSGHAV